MKEKELPECFRCFQFEKVPSRAEVDAAYEDMKAILQGDTVPKFLKIQYLADLLRRYNTCLYYLEHGQTI